MNVVALTAQIDNQPNVNGKSVHDNFVTYRLMTVNLEVAIMYSNFLKNIVQYRKLVWKNRICENIAH